MPIGRGVDIVREASQGAVYQFGIEPCFQGVILGAWLHRRLSILSASAFRAGEEAATGAAIQRHTDLEVKADFETQLLADFDKLFLSRIRKASVFIDAKLLKFQKANIGRAPERWNYRLVQTFASEELREKWRAHADHKIAWHAAIEKHVGTPFIAFFFDSRE